jgi:hypothetical protein
MAWRNHIKVHKAADLFPMMSEPELRELGEDIKKNKQRVQVIFWIPSGRSRPEPAPPKGSALLIDGRNRLDAMEMVGLPVFDKSGVPAFNWRFMEGNPYDLVLSLNINRRHLDEEERRDLIAKVIKAKPDESDRSIAKKVKRDHKTVAKVRKKMESGGEVSPTEKRTGADGKKYKSGPKNKKTKREWEAAKAADIAAEKPRATGSAVVDLEDRRKQMAALADDPTESDGRRAVAALARGLVAAGVVTLPAPETATAPKPDQDSQRASREALTSFKLACQDQLPLLTERDWLEAKLFISAYVEERDRKARATPDPNQGDFGEVWEDMEAAE